MISSDFKYSIQSQAIGGSSVLINYNVYTGGIYKIDDIAIRIENGNLLQLQQATTISLTTPGVLGQAIHVKVDTSDSPFRVVDSQIVGNYYLYSILTENQRVTVNNPASASYATDVLIEPGQATPLQIIEDYSVLQGNYIINRESSNRVQSDRLYLTSGSKTNPVNLYSIISNIATPAHIQDSNYSDTGWINGRYNGSKLTSIGNHGADPFIQGTFFEGAFFGKDIDDLYISEIAPSDLTFGQYFFSGKLDTLSYTLEDTNFSVIDRQISSIETIPTILPGKVINIGDLMLLSGSSSGFSREILQIIPPTGSQQYFPYISQSAIPGGGTEIYYRWLQVKNNYNNTPTTAWSYGENHELYRIVPTKVYTLAGNLVQSVTQGKIRVKGTIDVVYVDNSGYVVSGSIVNYI